MPIKKQWSAGVDLNRVAQKEAQAILAKQNIRQYAPVYLYDSYDTIYVIESQLDDQPTLRWDPIKMPFNLDNSGRGVQASLSQAILNKISLRALLEKRLRRLYRSLLLAAEILPEEAALKRVLKLQVIVTDAPRIITL